ncbi:HalOD1 output domain-containing protein [Natronococcus wangiae]|uniref:HalOD1 output domain-containing protein n=1 Tax=Natronococcus wangiae TaxID=3068275 RepID=UPI00273E8394|nr:HalOD1 output domain-containing protein [Natronococcus sp. AD5]
MERGDELPLVIAERIAEREGATPVDLHPPLYESIDTDALESLLDSSDATISVSFTYRGYTVRVDGSGSVRISEPRADGSRTEVNA